MDEFFEKQPWLHCQNSFDDDQVQLPRMPPKSDRRKGEQRIHSLHFGRQKNQNLGQGNAEKNRHRFTGIRSDLNQLAKRLNAADQYDEDDRKAIEEARKAPNEIW